MRPVPIDAVDEYLLRTNPEIRTALDLEIARAVRRIKLDAVLESARLLVGDYREPDGYDPEPVRY